MIGEMGFQEIILMLIAVSSFGESLRRVLPHRPGGGNFNVPDFDVLTGNQVHIFKMSFLGISRGQAEQQKRSSPHLE